MQALCAKDGGIRVYESVTLSPAQYDEVMSFKAKAPSREEYFGPNYLYVEKIETLFGKDADPNRGQARLTRGYFAIYRRSDNKLLGEQVQYGRSGGDIVTFVFPPSNKTCPVFEKGVDRIVFVRGK
jgi:hypothetical protein